MASSPRLQIEAPETFLTGVFFDGTIEGVSFVKWRRSQAGTFEEGVFGTAWAAGLNLTLFHLFFASQLGVGLFHLVDSLV